MTRVLDVYFRDTKAGVHQEDFCQALSVPPELKYEAEGGPGAEHALELQNMLSN